MIEIKIENRKIKFLIDDEDYDKVSRYQWYLSGPNHKQIRAFMGTTIIHLVNIITNSQILHDHKDRNFLNNQKYNLRPCTQSQNGMNKSKSKGKSSQYKGVSYCRRDNVWRAHIKINSESRALGTFKSEKTAAYHYDEAAKELFGEFAALNFPLRVAIS